jgi:predicted patatin/cPLA2 family phospholipase
MDIFDTDTYIKNPMDFYVVATDMDTGKAVYHNCLTGDEKDLTWIRASASMPVASRPVIIGGRKFSDGGTANAVPLDFMMHKGIEKNVVILTQPDSYRKEQMKNFGLIKLMLARYPAIVRALETRPARYNRNIDFIRQQEAAGNAFVIRPDASLNIGSVERDPAELERVYQIGREVALRELPALQEFIEKNRGLT